MKTTTDSSPVQPFDFSEVAKRIPFQMQSHINMGTEHALMHFNETLNIACETVTKYKRGVPGKSQRHFYLNEKASTIYSTLTELLNSRPLIGQLAEVTYPPNSKPTDE